MHDLDFTENSCVKYTFSKIQKALIVSPKPQLMHGDWLGTGITAQKSAGNGEVQGLLLKGGNEADCLINDPGGGNPPWHNDGTVFFVKLWPNR